MFMTDVNDVKIYNLSAGKSLPNVNKISKNPNFPVSGWLISNKNYIIIFITNLIAVVNRRKAKKTFKTKCGPSQTHRTYTGF